MFFTQFAFCLLLYSSMVIRERTLRKDINQNTHVLHLFFLTGMKKFEYKGKQWHEECFVCMVCKQPIRNKSFIPRENEAVCVPCYEEQFAQKCSKCNGVRYKILSSLFTNSIRINVLKNLHLSILPQDFHSVSIYFICSFNVLLNYLF